MKNYKNKLLVTLLTVFALFSFTSCELDYRWISGTIDYPADITISPSGKLYSEINIDESWIVARGAGRYLDIHDIKFLFGQIDVSVDIYGYVDEMSLIIAGTNEYLPFDDFNGFWSDDSTEAQRFLSIMVEEIRRRGYVTIIVEGIGDPRTKIGIDFGMDLEVYIRD